MKPLLHYPLIVFFAAVLPAAAQDSKPIWKPSVGDSWTYKVVVETREGTQLPEEVSGQKIEKFEGKVRATFQQTSVYRGVEKMTEKSGSAHAFYVSSGGQLEEIQYMEITPDAVRAAGTKQEGKNPQDVMPLSAPVPLAEAGWKGGEGFPFVMDTVVGGRKIHMVRKFKVLGWETLETGAGRFKALHVQVTGMNGPMELKRSYWFAPGTGFVKEVKKYYLGEQMVLSQTRVLEKTGKAAAVPAG